MKLFQEIFNDIPYVLREIVNVDNKTSECDVYVYPKDVEKIEGNLKSIPNKVYKVKNFLTPKNQHQYIVEQNGKYVILDLHAYLPLHRKVWLADFEALDEIIKNGKFKDDNIRWINSDDFNTLKLVKAILYLKFPKNKKHKKELENEILELFKNYTYRKLVDILPVKKNYISEVVENIKAKKNYDDILEKIKNPPIFDLQLKWFLLKKRFIYPFLTKPKWLKTNNCEQFNEIKGFNIIQTKKKDLKYFIRGFTGISVYCGNEQNFKNIYKEIFDKYTKEIK